MRTIVLSVLTGLLAACSSGSGPAPAPQGVASYGQPARTAPAPYAAPGARTAQPRPAAPTYAAAPAARGGSFRWHTRIADAQAQARAEGKLILVGTTQPGCSLCEKFKNQIVPGMGSQVSAQAVGYMLNAPKGGIRPEAPQLWSTLAQNLRGAGLMPLVGVFSADLRYLSGFGGPPDQGKLMNALAQARRMVPVSAAAPVRAAPSRTVARTLVGAQLNEFGEYEWTPVPLFPVEAIEPETRLAAAPAPATAPETAPATAPASAPTVAAEPGPALAPAPVVAEAAPPPAPALDPDTWAQSELERARAAIEAGQFDQARQMLETVRLQMPGTEAAREAARGGVALYNARRIRDADASERDRLTAQAADNLRGSMWGPLFS